MESVWSCLLMKSRDLAPVPVPEQPSAARGSAFDGSILEPHLAPRALDVALL